jgi:hypothetical protein
MARATKEQVDKHVEWAIFGGAPLGAYELAKEVNALRAENAENHATIAWLRDELERARANERKP